MINVCQTNAICACEPTMRANTSIEMTPGIRGPDKVALSLCPFCVAELHQKLGERLEQLQDVLKDKRTYKLNY